MKLGSRRLVHAVDDEAVQDPQANEEDAERPARVGSADRQQRFDCPDGGGDDPDHPTEAPLPMSEAPRGELD
jgi:hypothetical protein